MNNASTIGSSPIPFLLDYPLDDVQNVLNTNLIELFFYDSNSVTSDAGIVGYAGWGAYGISKFSLEGLSQTWTVELKDSAVRVNLVDPGNMDTAMRRAAEPDEDPNEWADPAGVTDVSLFQVYNSHIFLLTSRKIKIS